MNQIKRRLISALLVLATVLTLLPTAALAATTTGKGIKPTSNTLFWVARKSSSGNSFIHKPPTAAGKMLYCLDYGYSYSSSNSTFLNSYNYTSATGADADALWAEATAGSGLSEMDAATQENVKWMMSYAADQSGDFAGALLMSVQTYIWEHQSNKLAGADDLGEVDGGGFANPDTYDEYKGYIDKMLQYKAQEDGRLQDQVDSYAANGTEAEIVEDDAQKWAVLATSSKSGRQMFLAYHTGWKVVPKDPDPDIDPTPDDPTPDTPSEPKKVTFKKVKAGTTQGLDGAVINIYVDGQIVGSDVTANGGIIEFEAEPGTLVTFVEREAPEGYAVDPTPHSVFVPESEDGGEGGSEAESGEGESEQELTVTLENASMPGMKIVKTDAQTGAPISGTVFSIKGVNTDFSTSATTGADGTATLDGLEPGVYVVCEESVPEPYVRTNTEQTVALQPGKISEVSFEDYHPEYATAYNAEVKTGEDAVRARFADVLGTGSEANHSERRMIKMTPKVGTRYYVPF